MGHFVAVGHFLRYFAVLAAIAISADAQTTAPNEWTWVGGSGALVITSSNQYAGQPGVYGTLGTPAVGNIPGGRDSSATWTDSNGNLWLFGGSGFDANSNYGQLNDVWQFNPITNKWTWFGGSSAMPVSCAGSATVKCGQPGTYGSRGIPAAANIPGGRSGASFWTDKNGNFWLLGGYGFDAQGHLGELNDLWMFDTNTKWWTWIAGSSTVGSNPGQPGIYNTLGVPAPTNVPGGRDSAASWTDQSGHFWLYGGEGFDGNGTYGQLDDLWEFDPSVGQWVWVSGNNRVPARCSNSTINNGLCGWPVIYGALGVAAPAINPGSRVAASSWTDNNGNFWLFGGLGSVFSMTMDFSLIDQYDLWEFNLSTHQWAWMGGNSIAACQLGGISDWCNQDGVYGTLGTPAVSNIAASRSNATSWTDAKGNLWLFGGIQTATTNNNSPAGFCNDTWVFNPSANEWAMMNGEYPQFASFGFSNCDLASGSWGIAGTPAAANIPSGRSGAASWADHNGNFWIFGGVGNPKNSPDSADMNDLWVYQPLTPNPVPSAELVASPNPVFVTAGGNPSTVATTISLITAGGFNTPVSLIAGSSFPGITASSNPPTITGAAASQLTVSVAASAPGGASPVTVASSCCTGAPTIQVIVNVVTGTNGTPTFSVPSGTYSTAQTVTISGSGSFPIIYYTIDGSTPTTNSAVYVSPITVSSTTTLKAIALGPDSHIGPSAIATAVYTIVPATPNFTISGTALTLSPGATTGNTSTITLTPIAGFTGVINLTCSVAPVAASDPAACSIPPSVSISGSTAQTATLTVNTTARSATLVPAASPSWLPVSGVTFACIAFIGIPAKRKSRQRILGLLVFLLFTAGGTFGCSGGGNGGGGGGGGNPGTTAGAYVITVTGTSGTLTQTGQVALTVQ